ncbi:MAG: hypothetical protein ACAH88_01870 [Roseimicrobium sp.]
MRQAIFALVLAVPVSMPAQEAGSFVPPCVHPVERYQPGWEKNAFVLKVAPPVQEQVSFARDWIIAGCFGAEDDPIVVLVNTKTRERTRIKKGEPASNGMSLQSVIFNASRKDTVAEVALGGATAMLRFDESFLKQAKGRQKPQTVARGQSSEAETSGGTPAMGDAPVASLPRDQGSGFPNGYGNSDDNGTVASIAELSPTEGRKRMLTAMKPVGGKR